MRIRNKIKDYDIVIIYGAGKVGSLVVGYMQKKYPKKHVMVAITDKSINGKTCMGIKVKSIYDLVEYRKSALLIIASLDKFHGTMGYIARELGFENMYMINQKDYREITKIALSFSDFCKQKIKQFPKSLCIMILKKIRLKNTIIFRTHTLRPEGSCETIFRYMLKNNLLTRFHVVWLVDGSDKYYDTKECKYLDVHKNHTLKNLFYLVTSRFLIWENDPILKYRNGQKSIHITHGIPTIKNVHGLINIPEETDSVLISSKNLIDLQAYQMCMDKSKYVICGLPRLDDMFCGTNELNKLEISADKTVIWMPTFRKLNYSSRTDGDLDGEIGLPLLKTVEDMKMLNKMLIINNICLLVKIHPLQDMSLISIHNFSNIKIITNELLAEKGINLYSLIGQTHGLITDYSSVSFDYLLLNRPIAYVLDDMNKYKIGFALDNIFEFMPGNKIYSLNDLIEFLEMITQEEDIYVEERKKLKDFCHDFQDNKNTERFWHTVIESNI